MNLNLTLIAQALAFAALIWLIVYSLIEYGGTWLREP